MTYHFSEIFIRRTVFFVGQCLVRLLGNRDIFYVALVSAGFMSTNTQNTQQAIAKSQSMKSLMSGNNSIMKLGVISMPIVCTTLNDVLNATLSGVFGGDMMTMDGGNNETN